MNTTESSKREAVMYTVTAKNSDACSDGAVSFLDIGDSATCQAAAATLEGYTFHFDYHNETDYPKGCYLQSGVVYFNVHGIGSTEGCIASGKPCRAICSASDYITTVGKCADSNNMAGGYCYTDPTTPDPPTSPATCFAAGTTLGQQ